jgi:hypothetical protein
MAPAKLQARQWKYNNLRSETYLLVEAKFCLKCSEDAQQSSHRNHLSSDNIRFIIRCAYHATPKSKTEKKNGTHPGGENQPTEWRLPPRPAHFWIYRQLGFHQPL